MRLRSRCLAHPPREEEGEVGDTDFMVLCFGHATYGGIEGIRSDNEVIESNLEYRIFLIFNLIND